MKNFIHFITTTLFAILLLCSTYAQQNGILWAEDFEGDWTQNWYVDNGIWEVGVPGSGPSAAYQGIKCAATILNGEYPNDADTRLIRNTSFIIPDDSESPRLRFWHWFDFDAFGGNDWGKVQIKVEGSPNWIDISSLFKNTGSNVWSCSSIDLSGYKGHTVKIAFYFYATDIFCGCGWYIDKVSVITGELVLNNPETWEHGIGDWSVDMGAWEVGTPSVGPNSAHQGLRCAGTALGGEYANDVSSRLISPVFEVPTGYNSNLQFWHWFVFDSFGGADYGVIQITQAGSIQWENISDLFVNSSGGIWSYTSVDLTAYAGQQVQIAFYIYADDIFCKSGWYIDEIKFGGMVSNGTDFISYSLPGQVGESQKNFQGHTIFARVDENENLAEFIATFTMNDGAVASIDGIVQSTGLTTNDFTNPIVYLITAEDSTTQQEWIVTVEKSSSINKYTIGNANIYPNPFSVKTTIEFPNPTHSNYTLSIFNISGNKVFQRPNQRSDKIEFERGSLPGGVYLIEINGEMVFRGKMVMN